MQDVWIQISIGALVLATGIAWGVLSHQVKTLSKQWEDAINWMKSIQTKTDTNTTDIAVLAAIVKDRTERES